MSHTEVTEDRQSIRQLYWHERTAERTRAHLVTLHWVESHLFLSLHHAFWYI